MYKYEYLQHILDSNSISRIQEEAVLLCLTKHEHIGSNGVRSGFLLGDGAGVGKGRTIASIIYDNYMRGRKRSLWISVSPDLADVCQEDFVDIRSDIKVHTFSKNTENFLDGVLFCTYNTLGLISDVDNNNLDKLKGVVGPNFDGVVS